MASDMLREMRLGIQRFWGLKWIIKGPVIALVAIVFLGVIASVAGGGEDKEPDGTSVEATVTGTGSAGSATATMSPRPETATPEPTQPPETPTPAPTPQPGPQDVILTGSGQSVSDQFVLDEGLAVFEMSHDGGSNFAIWLMSASSGEQVELLANEIGAFQGRKAVGVTGGIGAEAGPYVLDITADGNWSVTIKQPRPNSGPPAPLSLEGVGKDVAGPFELRERLSTFTMTHNGSRNFAVWLYSADGDQVDLLANEIGPFSGEKAVGVTGDLLDASPGLHYLDVTADGAWSISVSQ